MKSLLQYLSTFIKTYQTLVIGVVALGLLCLVVTLHYERNAAIRANAVFKIQHDSLSAKITDLSKRNELLLKQRDSLAKAALATAAKTPAVIDRVVKSARLVTITDTVRSVTDTSTQIQTVTLQMVPLDSIQPLITQARDEATAIQALSDTTLIHGLKAQIVDLNTLVQLDDAEIARLNRQNKWTVVRSFLEGAVTIIGVRAILSVVH